MALHNHSLRAMSLEERVFQFMFRSLLLCEKDLCRLRYHKYGLRNDVAAANKGVLWDWSKTSKQNIRQPTKTIFSAAL